MLLSPVALALEGDSPVCVTSTGYVNDPNPPLNVRSSPDIRSDNIVYSVANGQELWLIARSGDWFRVKNPRSYGPKNVWVAAAFIDWACNSAKETVNTFPATIKKRIPPMGEHSYFLQLKKGQKLSIASENLFRTSQNPACSWWRLGLSESDDPLAKAVREELNRDNEQAKILCKANDQGTVIFHAPVTGKYVIVVAAWKKWYEYEIIVNVQDD